MHLSDTLSDRDGVKCCEFSVTAARCVFRLGAMRKVPCQGTSVRKKGKRRGETFREKEGGKINRGLGVERENGGGGDDR